MGRRELPCLPVLRKRGRNNLALLHLWDPAGTKHLNIGSLERGSHCNAPGKSDITPVQLCPASALLWMFTSHVESVTHRLSVQDLWICLICGHVGCGRYRAKHSIDHWKDSGHVYALELETQRVWDYVGDGYVHRLIQSKTDGKLVEVPSPAPAAASSRAATEDSCSSYALACGYAADVTRASLHAPHRCLPIT